MLKTSDYTIFVDLPAERGDVLLVHGYTAAYDRVSSQVAGYLKSLRRKADAPAPGSWTPSAKTLELLRRRGYLTEKSAEQEQQLLERLVRSIHLASQRRMPVYVIMPTYDCNLRCRYCFQADVRAGGAASVLRIMDREMVDRIFASFPKLEAKHGVNGDGKQLRAFQLFGGEPLQRATLPVVSYLFEKARSTGPARFSAVSNCMDLHLFRRFLGPDGIRSIQVTFDGPPAEHDRRRVRADGSGSFERIADNVGIALAKGVEISARINLDRSNVAGLEALAEEMVKRGWQAMKGFTAYGAAIHGQADRSDELGSWDVHRAVLRARERQQGRAFLGFPGDAVRRSVRSILKGQRNGSPRLRASFCSAHDTMYVFDPFGRIFACWERTGSDEHAIARLTPEGEPMFDPQAEGLWRSRTVLSNPTCRACAHALCCGGGCAALAQQTHGSYHGHSCDGFQQRFRAQVAEAFLERAAEGRPAQISALGHPS